MDDRTKGIIGLAIIAYLLWRNSKKSESQEGPVVTDTPVDDVILPPGDPIIEPILGCTDPAAQNYDPGATTEGGYDGLCDYLPPTAPVSGCTLSDAINYDPQAFIDDGSCDLSNIVFGCPFQGAINYNPEATIDDGTCDFGLGDDPVVPPEPEPNTTCYGDCPNTQGISVVGLSCPATHPNTEQPRCDIASSFGCTDPSAENFNPHAIHDDGSCIIMGCTDNEAINYEPNATHNCNITGGTNGFIDEQLTI
jgi:hypothetical protein